MEVQTLPSDVQAVRKVFTEAQRTVQCHQRCCDALRRLLSKHESAWDEYFACVVRILVFGTRRNPDVERLVQFVALAAVSVSVSSMDRSVGGQDRRSDGGSRSSSSLARDTGGASLLERTVEFLLEHSGAADKGVRFRCCQLLGLVTTEFSQIQGMEEEYLDRVVRVLLPRLQDKEWRVREQAVVSLRPFQFGQESNDDEGVEEDEEALLKEDRVREGLIGAMTSDSQPHVRQAALAAVTKTVGIIDQMMFRTLDVDERVRKAAFRTLGEDVTSKLLQPHQMLTLLKRGLSDKPSVADACRFMLCARWLKEVKYDPIELLKRVDVVQVEHVHLQKVPETLAKEIVRLGLRANRERGDPSLGLGFTVEDAKGLRNAAGRRVYLGIAPTSPPLPVSKGMDDDDDAAVAASRDGSCRPLPEEALFARVQAEVIKEDKEMSAVERETRLEAIMPNTTSLCEQIALKLGKVKELLDGVEEEQQGIADDIEMRIESDVFVLQQLLMLATHADFSEEAGRRRLVILLQGLLVDVNMTCQLVEPTMNALSAAHPSEADFVRVVAELVSDIWDLVHTRQIQNASMNISLDASFSSAITGGGGCSGVTPDRSVRAVMESGIRAAIPRNIVRDRARAIEGLPIMEGLEERGCSGARQGLESSLGLRQTVVGNENNSTISAHEGDEDVENAGSDMRRMFRILDMLSAILTKTKQTLARDATLRAFDEVIMDIFDWSARVLPSLCLDVRGYGPELLIAVMTVRGKYSLLGDADTAAKQHGPFFLKIARDEEHWVGVRISALQALSDLSLIFRTTTFTTLDSDVLVDGDVLDLLAGILRDRTADRMLLAVTAEIVARFLFAEITHDPELLARLFVLYFEKGSAADPRSSTVSPSEEERKDDEDDDGEVEEDARTVGGSLRLSQILSVYFSTLPYQAVRPKVRDMLLESMRHVLRVLREVAELNAAAETNEGTLYRDGDGGITLIEVPVQEVVSMVWRLLEKAASLEPSDDNSSKSAEAASPNVEDGVERADAEAKAKAEPYDVDQDGQVGSAVEAAGHAALCITEELWTLSGVDGVSNLVESLAKVLKSLALPEDQTTLKCLRNNVDRLEALGERQLGSKVAKIIEKYAQVLLDADLTPYDGVGSKGRADREAEDETENNSRLTGKAAAAAPKKSTKARRSKEPAPASCGRPSRQSKVAARMRMMNADATAAALEVEYSGSEADDTMEGGGDGVVQVLSEGEDEESGGTRRSFSTRGKGAGRSRTAKSTGRPALSEIVSNSPEGRRQSR